MAESKKAQVFPLFDQGFRPSSDEVKAIVPVSKTRYNYFQEWKKTQPGSDGGGPSGSDVPASPGARSGAPGAPMVVGKITITPENWGMDQQGAILIIDTYNKAKRDLKYEGTVGEFLCDIALFYRRIFGYEEVDYGKPTATPASKGGGGGQGNGGKDLGARVLGPG